MRIASGSGYFVLAAKPDQSFCGAKIRVFLGAAGTPKTI